MEKDEPERCSKGCGAKATYFIGCSFSKAITYYCDFHYEQWRKTLTVPETHYRNFHYRQWRLRESYQ